MKRISISPPVAALILAVILFILSGLLPNGFGSDLEVAKAQATNILRLSVFLGVIAAGQTLVIISGSEGIDLSAGSVVTLTAILTYVIVNGADEKVLLALLASLAVGALIGLLNGVGITFLKISPFVMTLGMSGVVTGAIIIANHGNVSGKVAPIMTRLIARPLSPSFPIPNALIIWLIFGFLMWLLFERGTLLSGGKGSYWGTMAGAIVLTLITSLLTTMQLPDSVRRMVLGATLLILISIYGRQKALRQ